MQQKTFDGSHRRIATAGLAIALTLFSGAPAGAEEEPVLTLERAIAIALEQNHELEAAAARRGAAAAGFEEARADPRSRLR